MNKSRPRVAILLGSASDEEQMKPCGKVLRDFDIPYVAKVLSAHRTPNESVEFVSNAKNNGVQVIIAAAGGAAHLAGVCAAHTSLPVIGVPIESASLKGLDSLLSTVQMPPGIPVGTVAIGAMGSGNAAYLAIRIMALSDEALTQKIMEHKTSMRDKILKTEVNL